MVKNYKVKNDIIFSYIFSNEGILKEFLEAVLEKKIEKVEVENQFKLNRHNFKEKLGVLDIKATINDDTLVDLEMQNNVYKSYIQRIYLYFGGLVKSQVKKGMTYDSLKDVIIINILNESMFEKIDKVHTVWQLREKNNLEHESLKGLSVHFIDLERFRKSSPDLAEKLNQWLAFVDTENQEWVNFVMENNKKIEEASKLKENFTADGVTQEMLELYEKWDMDERTLKKEAREAGMAEGLAEGRAEGRAQGLAEGKAEGRAQGLAEGKAEGRAQGLAEGKAEGKAEGRVEGEKIGIEKGKKENQREVVKAMYENNIDVITICKVTSLLKEEVEDIIKNIK